MTADLAYAFRSPQEELERAIADYLAISRNAHLYADATAHERAEQRAWQRIEDLRERIAAEGGDPDAAAE